MHKLRGYTPIVFDKTHVDYDKFSFNQKLSEGSDEVVDDVWNKLISDLDHISKQCSEVQNDLLQKEYFESLLQQRETLIGKIKACEREWNKRRKKLEQAFKDAFPNEKEMVKKAWVDYMENGEVVRRLVNNPAYERQRNKDDPDSSFLVSK